MNSLTFAKNLMGTKVFKLSLIISFSFGLVFCSSAPPQTDLETVFKKIPDEKYQDLIDENTQNDKRYQGFYNTYQISATMLTSKVSEALLQREGFFMQWEPTQAREAREKTIQEQSSSSKFFISLFTPKTGHNDLHKEASMWKVYLEVGGVRYKGKVRKLDKNLVQMQNLYPYHSRFSKGYVATFEVPTNVMEQGGSVLIMTSSLGTTTFKY